MQLPGKLAFPAGMTRQAFSLTLGAMPNPRFPAPVCCLSPDLALGIR
jgi:hypothetical protein